MSAQLCFSSRVCDHFKELLRLTTLKYQSKGILNDEYEKLEQVPPEPGRPDFQHDAMVNLKLCQEACKFPFKNRYCNLFPFDKTLVSLGDPSRYINASWIRFAESQDSYIATMGPMLSSSYSSKYQPDSGGADNTCMDFWDMCWQTHTRIVVMLCVLQPGFTGCSPYFPQNEESIEVRFLPFTIRLVEIDETEHSSVRKFLVSRETETREILHFQFKSWPNYGVPEEPGPISEFVRQVHEAVSLESSDPQAPKFVVHCSGGIGRSGTFLSAFHTYSTLKRLLSNDEQSILSSPLKPISMFDLVWQMRLQRHPWMVEGLQQFKMAYGIVIYLLEKIISEMDDKVRK